MMGQEKEPEGVLEVEPEASCDVEMTLQQIAELECFEHKKNKCDPQKK